MRGLKMMIERIGLAALACATLACGDSTTDADTADTRAGDTTSPDTTPGDTADTQADTQADDTREDTGPDTADTVPADTHDTNDTAAADTTPTDVAADTNETDTRIGSGTSCLDPHVIAIPSPWTAPIQVSGDTRGKGDDHATTSGLCGDMDWDEGEGAADEAWSFRAPSTGIYRLELRSTAGADVGFYALRSCVTGPSTERCLGGMDWSDNGPWVDVITLRLTADQPVELIVDGWKPGYEGAYELTLVPPAAEAPGNRCALARPLTSDGQGGWRGTGDLLSNPGLTDEYSAKSCGASSPGGQGSQDEVWSFTAPADGAYQAILTTEAGKDVMLYTFGAESCGRTCTAVADERDASSDTPETLDLGDLVAGQVLNLVVDAWWFYDAGPYELRVVPFP